MTCHDAKELFSALVDEALGAAERADLDAHLAGCAECRRELERFQSTVALLHRVEPARAPAGFVDRVLTAVQPTPWYRRLLRAVFLPWPMKLPLEAAAIVLVGVIVTLVYRQTPELDQAARLESEPPAVSEAPAHPAPRPDDKRDTSESRDSLGKREERANVRDEADAARRQDAAKAAPAPRAATAPAVPAPAAPALAAPGEKKAAEAPGGVAAGQVRPSVKESAGADVAAQRLSAARVAPAALDVTGRLSVADRDAALRALGDLVARAGGREVARRATPDGLVIELAVPRPKLAEFVREVARLGRFTPESQAGDLPDDVGVSLRITD